MGVWGYKVRDLLKSFTPVVSATDGDILAPIYPAQQRDSISTMSVESGYGVILADPPWNWKARSQKGEGRSAKNHYSIMEQADLCGMSVRDFAAPDCVLFLWVLNSMLGQGLQLLDAWGFAFKTVGFCWVKTNRKSGSLFMGLGYHTLQNVELCLIATRGKPKRLSGGVHQVVMSPRREHSRKPDEVYERIEALYPGPYLELFSRTNRKGWDQQGYQTGRWSHG